MCDDSPEPERSTTDTDGLYAAIDAAVRTATRAPLDVAADCRTIERHRDCGTGHGYCDDSPHGNADREPCPDLRDVGLRYALRWDDTGRGWRRHRNEGKGVTIPAASDPAGPQHSGPPVDAAVDACGG